MHDFAQMTQDRLSEFGGVGDAGIDARITGGHSGLQL
jgi:hypothetical protein